MTSISANLRLVDFDNVAPDTLQNQIINAIDTANAFLDNMSATTDDITANGKDTTKYIITTHLSKEELISLVPKLQGIEDRVFILDCFQIARDTIGKAIPNTPMLGAFMKVSGMFELDYFKEKMKGVLKKLPQNVIDANMIAIQRAYDEVH